jgi:hypothetical protein
MRPDDQGIEPGSILNDTVHYVMLRVYNLMTDPCLPDRLDIQSGADKWRLHEKSTW